MRWLTRRFASGRRRPPVADLSSVGLSTFLCANRKLAMIRSFSTLIVLTLFPLALFVASNTSGQEAKRYIVKKPVWTVEEREERYTVLKPVEETSEREETYTVLKPVVETSEREQTYVVQKPVYETSERED